MKTQTITPNQTFKHGTKTFEKGKKYKVSPDDANYFKSAGWVGEVTGSEPATLNVHDGKLGQKSEVK